MCGECVDELAPSTTPTAAVKPVPASQARFAGPLPEAMDRWWSADEREILDLLEVFCGIDRPGDLRDATIGAGGRAKGVDTCLAGAAHNVSDICDCIGHQEFQQGMVQHALLVLGRTMEKVGIRYTKLSAGEQGTGMLCNRGRSALVLCPRGSSFFLLRSSSDARHCVHPTRHCRMQRTRLQTNTPSVCAAPSSRRMPTMIRFHYFLLPNRAHRSPGGGGRRDDDFDDFDDSFPRRPVLDDSSQLMDDALEQIRGWTMSAASMLLPVAFADNTLWLAHSYDSWTTWMAKVHATVQAMIGAAHAAEPAYHQVTLHTSDDRLLRLSFETSQTIV